MNLLTLDLSCSLLKMLTPERALPIEELRVINAQPKKKKEKLNLITLINERSTKECERF